MVRNWRWLIKVAISAGLLWLIFRSVPFPAIWASLRQAHSRDVIIGLVLAVPITIIAAMRLQLLLGSTGVPMPLGEVLLTINR